MLCIKMKKNKHFCLVLIFLFILIAVCNLKFSSAASYGSGAYGTGAYGVGYTVSASAGAGSSYLYKGQKIIFEFNNTLYAVTLESIINSTVSIKVDGDDKAWSINLNPAQVQKIDLNDDGVYDVQFFLEKITEQWVILNVKLIQEQIPAENVTEEEQESIAPPEKINEETTWRITAFLVCGLIILTVIGLIVKIRDLRKKKHR
jgi:hypothetical protein